ncbi:MAG: LPS assembly lipoprotein LptE [Candidatus Omnitrophica bacterium]|nr:LPS assembly lipoprotein LptE [Candidatus Omnitrophota bacterium]
MVFRNQNSGIRSQIFLFFVFCYLLSIIGGCGYTTRSMIAGKFDTIYVAPFENKINITQEVYAANKYRIYRPLLETDITRTVVDKFLFDGNLKLAGEESADLILKGKLIEFRRDPLRYDDNDNVTEYRLNLVVNISLWDKIENRLIWEEKGFTGTTAYFTSGQDAKSEDTAVVEALDDLARRIVERTVEQW